MRTIDDLRRRLPDEDFGFEIERTERAEVSLKEFGDQAVSHVFRAELKDQPFLFRARARTRTRSGCGSASESRHFKHEWICQRGRRRAAPDALDQRTL